MGARVPHRRSLSRRGLLLAVGLLGLSPAASGCRGSEPVPLAAGRDDGPLAGLLMPLRERYGLPSLAAGVIVGGRLQEVDAVGVRAAPRGAAVTVDDTYHLGSCTKAMTATLAGLLVDEGRWHWDDRLPQLLATVERMHPAWSAATLEHVLHHRAGMPAHTDSREVGRFRRASAGAPSAVEARRRYLELLLRDPPAHEPGSRELYSNAGYVVVGAAAEQVMGVPYEALITQRLFTPLGMSSARFGAADGGARVDQPQPHLLADDGAPQVLPPGRDADNPAYMGPAGRAQASMRDWGQFLALHVNGGDSRLAQLQDSTLDRLHRPTGTSAAGWNVLRRSWAQGPVLQHAGSNTLNYAVAWLAPGSGLGLFAATNVAGDPATRACDRAVAALLEEFG